MDEMNSELQSEMNNLPEKELHIVPSWIRFINRLVDVIMGSIFISLVLRILNLDFKVDYTLVKTYDELKPLIQLQLISWGLMFIYYFVSEAFTGQTFGKMITRTHVVDDFGNKPSIARIALRSLCRFIPFDVFSFLFNPIGWHDSLSKTYVVKK